MQAPYRIASPPVPERTEEADSYEAMLHAGRRRYWLQMALIFTGVLAVTSMVVKISSAHLTGAEKARRQEALRIGEARAITFEARLALDHAESDFDREVHRALAHELSPTTPLEACPIAIGDPERLVRGHSQVPLLVLREGARESPFWSPSLERVWQDIRTAEDLAAGANPMAALVYTDALRSTPVEQRLSRDVVVVVSRWQPPTRTSETGYQPGRADGMVYVFDFATRKIACAGELHASSSRSLEYTYNDRHDVRGLRLDERLREDLDRQIARAVAEPNVLFAIR